MQLIIGNQNYSSWSMRFWVAMNHFGIAFESTKIELDTAAFAHQVSAYSSAQTVAVLITPHGAATDSLSNLETLADSYLIMWPAAKAKAGQNQGYLLGAFSIADAFFAPVVVRLQAYKVSVNGATQTYINTMLSTPAVKAWMATGVKETIILPADEAGTN